MIKKEHSQKRFNLASVGIGALACFILGLAVLLFPSSFSTAIKTSLEESLAALGIPLHDSVANPTPLTIRWQEHCAQRYQLRTDSAMNMQLDPSIPAKEVLVKMQATLDLYTLDVQSDIVIAGIQLNDVSLSVNGEINAQTNQSLSAPFRVYYQKNGIPIKFDYASDVAGEHRDMLENIVRMFQLSIQNKPNWLAQEGNTTGNYEASYQRTSAGRIEKSKQHFRTPKATGILAGADIESAEWFLLKPDQDWIAEAYIEEVLSHQGRTPNKPGLHIRNSASLILTAITPPLNPSTWAFVAAPTANKRVAQHSSVPQISVTEAIERISSAVSALNTANEGRSNWIYSLRDLLRIDSSLPAKLLNQMQNSKLSDRTQADLYLALELAATESAQSALLTVVNDTNWSTKDSLRAIVALSGVPKPSEETINGLWEVVDFTASSDPTDGIQQQLSSTATFALGTLGNRMREAQDESYSALRDRLMIGATSSTGTRHNDWQRSNYVHALGNTRDAEVAHQLSSLMGDNSASVRRAAALSIGMVANEKETRRLAERLNRESHQQVRGAIVEAMVSWENPTVEALDSVSKSLLSEGDENTRYQMTRFLGKHLDRYPKGQAVLEQTMRTESSKRIRQTVANTLVQHRQSI